MVYSFGDRSDNKLLKTSCGEEFNELVFVNLPVTACVHYLHHLLQQTIHTNS